MSGTGGEHHRIAQFRKESEPERIVLIHIQHSGNAHRTALCVAFRQRFVAKNTLVLIFKKVGNLFFVFLFAKTFFTTVSGNKGAVS